MQEVRPDLASEVQASKEAIVATAINQDQQMLAEKSILVAW